MTDQEARNEADEWNQGVGDSRAHDGGGSPSMYYVFMLENAESGKAKGESTRKSGQLTL